MSQYIPKAEQEKLFVKELLAVGIKRCMVMAEGRHDYYRFEMKDGRYRYWKDMSKESLVELGLKD